MASSFRFKIISIHKVINEIAMASQLFTSALLAFPVVYVILHMWKEIYQIFFNDGILYWVGIFVGVTLLTALTVIFRILRIVRLNPAEVIKNE